MSMCNYPDDCDIMEIIDETQDTPSKSEFEEETPEDTSKQGVLVTLNMVTEYLQHSDIPIIHDKKERDNQIILWLNEYHSLDDSQTERKQYLRDCVILNTFFLLPWILSSKNLPAPLFEDAIQTIIINLMRAIENYTPNSNYKFSSYISGYIKDGLKIAIHKEQIITVPIHRRLKKKNNDNSSKVLLPEVTMFDDTITMDNDKVYAYNPEYSLLDKEESAKDKIKSNVMHYFNNSYSIKYGHLYKDCELDNNASHFQRLMATLQFLLSDKCNLLNDYEKDVIIHHYGLFNNPKYTLDDIVTLLITKYNYKVSKPRISQISKRGVEKLKRYFNSLSIDIPKLF